MLAVDKLRALFQRAGMSAAESNAAVRNTSRPLAGLDTRMPPYRVLGQLFVWKDTPEGRAFWHKVHTRLYRAKLEATK